MSPDFSGSPFYPGGVSFLLQKSKRATLSDCCSPRGHGNIKYDEESTNWFTRADIPALKMVDPLPVGGMRNTKN